MTQIQEVSAEARTSRGKGPAYQARQKGLTPAIIYGGKDQPETVNVDSRTLERHIEKGAFLTTPSLSHRPGNACRGDRPAKR